MLTLVLVGTGPAAAEPPGATPGSYTFYRFPPGVSAFDSVSFSTTVTADPGRGNVFWAHQFTIGGHTGYVGMQRDRGDPGRFVFSMWDASTTVAGAFTAGHTYRYDITPLDGDYWQAMVTDTTAGTSFTLGALRGESGATIQATGMVDRVEYFDRNHAAATCADEPFSMADFGAPVGHVTAPARDVTAIVSGTRSGSTCTDRARVTTTSTGSTHRDAIGNSSSGAITGAGGKCVDITGGGAADGTQVQLWTCYPWGNNQNWVFASDGTFHALFKCLTVAGTARGTLARLSTCDGSPGQRWTLVGGALLNPNSGKCLDAAGGSGANGTKLEIWDCQGGANQQWHIPA